MMHEVFFTAESRRALPEALPLVQIHRVTRRFGSRLALDDVTLAVPRGGVFGLIGGNGAGKTTLIKHILGMFKPQTGAVSVFGLDPVARPVEVLGRIGYLSEDRDLPNWMRVAELLRYTQAFFPAWDPVYAEQLREAFDLDRQAKIRHLSRGQRARAGLLIALAHRPELLVLDEPSSGLDPVVRRDILTAILRTIADEGRTVLFSSHLLDEVERVADHVAMMHAGKIVLAGSIDDLKETHRRVSIRFADPCERPPRLVGAFSCVGGGREWTYTCQGESGQLKSAAEALGGLVVGEDPLSLEEIFVTHVQPQALPARDAAPDELAAVAAKTSRQTANAGDEPLN
ncbi:MAG: ABC transporter ATP-binding protein [Planctomycetaceae bacterium]